MDYCSQAERPRSPFACLQNPGKHFRATMRSSLFLGCCLALLLPATLGWAAPSKVVVLTRNSTSVNAKQVKWFGKAYRIALRKHAKINVPTNGTVQRQLVARKEPAGARASLKKFDAFMNKAKALYRTAIPMKKRCGYVLRALKLAEAEAETARAVMSGPTKLRELHLYLSLAYFGLQNKAKTSKHTLHLIQFAPSFMPGNAYPLDFRIYYKKTRTWLLNKPRYTMVIDTKPSGSKLYHNMVYVGKTPFTLKNLVQGKHLIRLVQTKYKIWERAANLIPSKTRGKRIINAKIPLKRDPHALSVGNDPIYEKDANYSDDILDHLDKVIARVGAKYLHIIEPHRGAKGYLLKIAIYQKGKRKIIYGTVNLGQTAGAFTSKIQTFANRFAKIVR